MDHAIIRQTNRELTDSMTPPFQPVCHLLQGHAFGFRHHKFYPDKLQHHHAAKKEENPTRRKGSYNLWKKSRQQRGEKPVGKTTERLALRAKFIGENFRDEHPDDGPLPDGMSGNESKNANRNDAVMPGEKGPGASPLLNLKTSPRLRRNKERDSS